MKKKLLKIAAFILVLIVVLKIFLLSSLKEAGSGYIDIIEHSVEVNIHLINKNHEDWKHLEAIISRAIGLQDYNHFDLRHNKIEEHSLSDVISEVGEFRRAFRNKIDKNKEMLANYNVYTENEAILLTLIDNEEITELREDISIVVDVFDDDVVNQKKKTFLEAYKPSIIANLIEGNCIGLRSPPAFKGAIHLV